MIITEPATSIRHLPENPGTTAELHDTTARRAALAVLCELGERAAAATEAAGPSRAAVAAPAKLPRRRNTTPLAVIR